MALHPDVIAAFESENIGEFVYLIDFGLDSGTLRFTTIANGATYDSNSYLYLGALGSVSTSSENEQLDPADYEVIIGAADSAILNIFLGEEILNRPCICYQAITNPDQSIIGEPWIYFIGNMQPVNEGGETPVLQIKVKDELADWDRDMSSLYTDAEQQRLHPGDSCLEFVSQLSGRDFDWPLSKWYEDNS